MRRHHALNDVVWHLLNKTGVPVVKEPSGLSRADGGRLDGMTLTLYMEQRQPLVWDVTFIDTMAKSYTCVVTESGGRSYAGRGAKDY